MVLIDREFSKRFMTALIAGSLFAAALFWLSTASLLVALSLIVLYICLVELPPLARTLPYGVLIYLYCGISGASIGALLFLDPTRTVLSALFIIVFCHDTAAYLIGRQYGRHYMCPHISPKKSWEGFCGGYVATIVMIWLLSFMIPLFAFPIGLILAVFIPPIATLGDLSVSLLKRRAGVKDTGFILPGHGGLLDRLDSILAVTPLVLIIYGITLL